MAEDVKPTFILMLSMSNSIEEIKQRMKHLGEMKLCISNAVYLSRYCLIVRLFTVQAKQNTICNFLSFMYMRNDLWGGNAARKEISRIISSCFRSYLHTFLVTLK